MLRHASVPPTLVELDGHQWFFVFFWDTTLNSLCRPEFLLWRTALVLDNSQYVSSEARDTITPQCHCIGAGFGGGLRAASQQVQGCCCGT